MTSSAAVRFVDRLDPSARDRLIGLGRTRKYPAHSIVFFEGDAAHHVFLVRSGHVKVSITVDAREVVLDVLGDGDILGEIAALDGRARSATATALTESDVVVVPTHALMAFLAECPEIAIVLMQSIASRLRDASRRQVESGALDGLGRVCRRLVELMDRYGDESGHGVVIRGPLTQGDIAAWAGLSREAVVKALQSLRALHWVTTTPRSITVVDADAVRARASQAPA